ncbi:MAG: chorismate synthase [Trueperaceae bacterium]|nr:chorismate synthase [Trueperaceae bacterium]
MEILGGPLFAIAGAGESHGPGVTTIVMGCPPGVRLERAEVQRYLDRRRPGSNKHGTPRNEADRVIFTAGIFNHEDQEALLAGPKVKVQEDELHWETSTYQDGFTTGEPIAAIVLSTTSKSQHYEQFAGERGEVRPGHTDLVKHKKSLGFVDYRGGGRSSYRSAISDVVGGSVARIALKQYFGTLFVSNIIQVGSLKTESRLADIFSTAQTDETRANDVLTRLESNTIYSLDADFAYEAGELIKETRKQGDSLGARVEVMALNVPALIGDPMYQSLKLKLMGTLGGLNAVTACEIGVGADAASKMGSENNDPIRSSGYQSNHHGGMIGGITTGMPLLATLTFKPTSTINKPQQSVRKDLSEVEHELKKGRHDPCVGVRASVALESRMAIEILNAVLMHQAMRIDKSQFKLF